MYLLRTGTMDVKRKIRLETTGKRPLYFASLIINRILLALFGENSIANLMKKLRTTELSKILLKQ